MAGEQHKSHRPISHLTKIIMYEFHYIFVRRFQSLHPNRFPFVSPAAGAYKLHIMMFYAYINSFAASNHRSIFCSNHNLIISASRSKQFQLVQLDSSADYAALR